MCDTAAVETNITVPIKDGDDVALLIFPGAFFEVAQYEQLGMLTAQQFKNQSGSFHLMVVERDIAFLLIFYETK